MKSCATRRGAKCTGGCNQSDQSQDPVEPQESRLWGSYKLKHSADDNETLVTEGATCWYDMKLFTGIGGNMMLQAWKDKRAEDEFYNDYCLKLIVWMVQDTVCFS